MQMYRTVLLLLLTAHHGLASSFEPKQLLSTLSKIGSALPSTALDVKQDRTREAETKFLRPKFETENKPSRTSRPTEIESNILVSRPTETEIFAFQIGVDTEIQALFETQPQCLVSMLRPRPNHGDQDRGHKLWSQGQSGLETKAVFDLTESRFGFTGNPDLDSLAYRTVWIRVRGPV